MNVALILKGDLLVNITTHHQQVHVHVDVHIRARAHTHTQTHSHPFNNLFVGLVTVSHLSPQPPFKKAFNTQRMLPNKLFLG